MVFGVFDDKFSLSKMCFQQPQKLHKSLFFLCAKALPNFVKGLWKTAKTCGKLGKPL